MDSTISVSENVNFEDISFSGELGEIIRKDSSWWHGLIIKLKKWEYEKVELENKFLKIKQQIILVKEKEMRSLFAENKNIDIRGY